jgi:ADP-heptose:LPS heptosyltransferase
MIPDELLVKADKILFIAHLALGDFTYLQNDFKAFAERYPHIKVHLWVDEVRRTTDASKWEGLKKYSLYDWVEACPFFDKVYKRTYSPALLKESIEEAQGENYPLVVSLTAVRPHFYAALAREISPRGFVVGIRERFKLMQLHHLFAYRKLDAFIPSYSVARNNVQHISGVYADWFRQLCGMNIPPEQRFPFVDIPEEWKDYAVRQLAQWKVNKNTDGLAFINSYAKTKKRCWPLSHVVELVQTMRKDEAWKNTFFIINAVPSELGNVQQMITDCGLDKVVAFSATENFFQLPAVLEHCDLIISVETAVMHLANAVHVPVIALMRQKNPEWVPIDSDNSIVITAAKRSDWVERIPVAQVMQALRPQQFENADSGI